MQNEVDKNIKSSSATLSSIYNWQHRNDVHPYTCGNNSNHKPLIPVENRGKGNIELKCLDCDYVQVYFSAYF